jgi:hypothetical protein
MKWPLLSEFRIHDPPRIQSHRARPVDHRHRHLRPDRLGLASESLDQLRQLVDRLRLAAEEFDLVLNPDAGETRFRSTAERSFLQSRAAVPNDLITLLLTQLQRGQIGTRDSG